MTIKRSSASKVSLLRFPYGIALISDGYTNGVIGAIITLLTRYYPESELGMQYRGQLLGSIMLAGTAICMLAFGRGSQRHNKMMFAAFYIGFFSIIAVSVSEQTEKEDIPENAQYWWSVLSTSESFVWPISYCQLSPDTMIDTGFVISVLGPFLLCCVIDENNLCIVWGTSIFLGVILASSWLQTLEWDHSWDDVCIPYRLALKKYWKSLLGLSLAWFIYDFITYPLVIYSSVIMNTVTGGSSSLIIVFGWTLFINLFFLPGSVLGAFLVDEHGLKNLMVCIAHYQSMHIRTLFCQIVGLLLQAIVGLGIGAMRDAVANHIAAYAVSPLHSNSLVALLIVLYRLPMEFS
ncbi:hypothetical protein BKA83DRAFT_3361552 [Pisolithus microcarpus]|nr:hypothetical protein BKA83DRAFT_3361552 [Pisolithus microcarpus]